MAGDYVSGGLSRLCRLIDDSSSRFKFEEIELSRDKEKETLIYLSKVLREFKGCIEGRGSLSEDFEEPASHGVCIDLNRGNLQCLTNRVFSLMPFLTVKSKYVQHLVGNIFVAASQLVATSGSRWGEFINLLCACLEVAISNALLNSSASFSRGNEILDFHLQGSELIRHSLENADWHTAAETLGILRRIIKVLKEELDEGQVEAFISSLRLTFVKLPWKLLNGTFFLGTPGQTISRRNSEQTESRILFLGYLIQLLCSLVELDVSEESSPGPEKDHTVLHMVNNVLPEISKLCLDQEETCHHTHIIPYFQHKFLILLMRLSSRLPYNCGAVSSWLHILHSYYEDLLMGPISRVCHDAQDDCLEGSPFLWSLCDQEKYLSSSLHLQRITIFLFLKCWLSLIDQGVSSNSNCACVRLNSVSDSNKVRACSSRQKGILEFYKWLELHVPFSLHTDNKAYIDNCISFASSFVALYIHEDDILFEVLLYLFNIVSYADKLVLKEEDDLHELNQDAFCHIANVFNPFLLFHIFLAKINYDHHLLLDYLISKDLGIQFAEYLLRFLRKVCDSWEEFVNLPVKETVYAQQSHKKRKLSLVSLNVSTDPVPTALHQKPALFRTEHEGDASEMNCGRESFQIMKARTCMLSLKESLIKLQRKSLFPYNPEVLLRRLKRFEELCRQYG